MSSTLEEHLILAKEKHLTVSQGAKWELEKIRKVLDLAKEARRGLRELWEGKPVMC